MPTENGDLRVYGAGVVPDGNGILFWGGYHKNEAGVKIYPKEVKRFGTVLERWSTLE